MVSPLMRRAIGAFVLRVLGLAGRRHGANGLPVVTSQEFRSEGSESPFGTTLSPDFPRLNSTTSYPGHRWEKGNPFYPVHGTPDSDSIRGGICTIADAQLSTHTLRSSAKISSTAVGSRRLPSSLRKS